MGLPEGEEKKKGTESLFKQVIDENFIKTYRKNWILESKRLTEKLIISIHKVLLQGTLY